MKRVGIAVLALIMLFALAGCADTLPFEDAYLRSYEDEPLADGLERAADEAGETVSISWSEGWIGTKTPDVTRLREEEQAVTMIMEQGEGESSYRMHFYFVYTEQNDLLAAAGLYDVSSKQLLDASKTQQILLATLRNE